MPYKPPAHNAARTAANAKAVRHAYENQGERREDKRFYGSTAWREFRALILGSRPFCECDVCRADGRRVPAEHVHHVLERKARPDLQFDPANVQALSRGCHSRIEARRKAEAGMLFGR